MPKRKQIFCDPDLCDHCQYIGEGDSWCDDTGKIVLSDWEPTEHYMGEGCPYSKGAWIIKEVHDG